MKRSEIWGGNRAARRWSEQQSGYRSYEDYRHRAERSHRKLSLARDAYNNVDVLNVPISQKVYKENAPIEEYLTAHIEHSGLVDEGWKMIREGQIPLNSQDYLGECGKHDFFTATEKGVSLKELAAFKLPLGKPEIDRLDRLFIPGILRRMSPGQNRMTTDLSNLAIRSQLLEESYVHLPQNLQRLSETMTAYFDYHAKLYTNPEEIFDDLFDLTNRFHKIFNPNSHLPQALVAYLPARMGISPSSQMEMYEHFLSLTKLWTKKVLDKRHEKNFLDVLSHAYMPSKVPEEIVPFILPDIENNKNAAQFLREQIPVPESEDEGYAFYKDSMQKVEFFNHKQSEGILRDMKWKNRVVNLSQENDYIKGIQIAKQYKKSFIVVVHLKNGTHITLDVLNSGSIYGMPHALDFGIVDKLTVDVFNLIENGLAEEKHAPVTQPIGESRRPQVSVYTKPESARQLPSHKRRPSHVQPAEDNEGGSDDLSLDGLQRKRENFVPYNDAVIREHLGSRVSDNDINRITNALHRFEFGDKQAVALAFDAEHNTYRLKAGDYRIVLERIGDHRFSVMKIGHRKDVYFRTTI